MRFTKMHGLGNDFVVLDGVADDALADIRDPAGLARRLCDRRTGVGADGLITIRRAEEGGEADLDMTLHNADGSTGELCVNGLRCIARLAHQRGYAPEDRGPRVRTGRGVVDVALRLDGQGRFLAATVNAGKPSTDLPGNIVNVAGLDEVGAAHEHLIEGLPAVFVSMGNPHMVSFTHEPVATIDLDRLGPMLERHEAFPSRINVHFVHALRTDEAEMRSWERGVGATPACGSGACAALVAGVLTSRLHRRITMRMPGGAAEVQWDEESGNVLLTGPAVIVFEGEFPG